MTEKQLKKTLDAGKKALKGDEALLITYLERPYSIHHMSIICDDFEFIEVVNKVLYDNKLKEIKHRDLLLTLNNREVKTFPWNALKLIEKVELCGRY